MAGVTGMRNGVFITFEGGDGCGKSTQAARLTDRLRRAGVDVVEAREPGGTPAGDRIRSLLLDPAMAGLDSLAELLLYEASRAQHVSAVIEPALAAGRVVVCDRFADSSLAYQGYARGLDLEMVERLNDIATRGLAPDLTLLLDVDPAEGVSRATNSGADRLEREALAFHQRVRDGFAQIARRDPARVHRVPAGSSDEVEAIVWRLAGQLLRRRGVLR